MATIKLFEAWLQSQAINELAPGGILDFTPISQLANTNNGLWVDTTNEVENREYERIKSLLKKNGIIFGDQINQALAAQILVTVFLQQGAEVVKKGALGWLTNSSTIKLMDSPSDPALILTTGVFAEDQIIDIGDDSASSDYYTIAKYCNNSAILKIARYLLTIRNINTTERINGAGIPLATDPNTGTLTWEFGAADQLLRFYGTTVTTAAQSMQVVNTISWEIPTTGKTIVKKLTGTVFATGQITLSNSKEVDAAVAELQNLKSDPNTIITKIEIESSASGDRPVDGQSGYPANTPAGKYKFGTPYTVQPTDNSANAKLAKGRGETIKAKFSNFGVVPTVKAVIQDGEDAAQYAKITVTVSKKGKPAETFSKTELDNILLKPSETKNLASTKTLSVWTAKTEPNFSATYPPAGQKGKIVG